MAAFFGKGKRIARGMRRRNAVNPERTRPGPSVASEPQMAAVIALGRLGAERGRDVLEKLAVAPDAVLRAAAVWALGRTAEARSAPALTRALQDPRVDVAALACLGVPGAVPFGSLAGDGASPAPRARLSRPGSPAITRPRRRCWRCWIRATTISNAAPPWPHLARPGACPLLSRP
jgi:hypothetical protein